MKNYIFREVVCAITAPMQGAVYQFFLNSITVISVLIILCYILFMFLIKRVQMSKFTIRHIWIWNLVELGYYFLKNRYSYLAIVL